MLLELFGDIYIFIEAHLLSRQSWKVLVLFTIIRFTEEEGEAQKGQVHGQMVHASM